MTEKASFAPLSAATGEPVQLAMQRLWLGGQFLPAGARLTVQHVFRSSEAKPLEIIYSFPLPRDAALRKFRISGEGFEANSELRATEEAVRAYERGLAQGSLSTLARQFGDGVINLAVGNIRPQETVTVTLEILAGVELRDDGLRFRFPFTLAPAYHRQARPSTISPGAGRMQMPAEFGGVVMPPILQDASNLHEVGFELSLAGMAAFEEIASPSHAVRVAPTRVSLAAARDLPDRDLVLDVRHREIAPLVVAGRDPEGRGHFAAIVPSTSFGGNPESTRRVVILVDRSGSMEGAPLTQAVKAIGACLGALSEQDSFGLIAFDDRVETFHPKLLSGSRENRARAAQFLQRIDARGGTELVPGFLEAVRLLEGGAGDVLILTDGQVAGTERILADARATQTRLHTLGIGSASQDRFLALLARETGGVSRFVTPRERVDLCAVDLFASIGRPVASGLTADPAVQPPPPQAVFSGTPVLLFGETGHEAGNEAGARVELQWKGGQLRLPIVFAGDGVGETVRLLRGSRLITDWESRYPKEAAASPEDKIHSGRVAARLLELSRTYGLASREMSLVAVVERAGDRPGELPQTRVVPVGMPQDTQFRAYFGAPMGAAAPVQAPPPLMCRQPVMPQSVMPQSMMDTAALPSAPRAGRSLFSSLARPKRVAIRETPEDGLLELAAAIESDGGMSGKDAASRAAATAVTLLAFVQHGHTAGSGAFRSHVARLVRFLETAVGLSASRREAIAAALESARQGRAPEGDWLALARVGGSRWDQLEALAAK